MKVLDEMKLQRADSHETNCPLINESLPVDTLPETSLSVGEEVDGEGKTNRRRCLPRNSSVCLVIEDASSKQYPAAEVDYKLFQREKTW